MVKASRKVANASDEKVEVITDETNLDFSTNSIQFEAGDTSMVLPKQFRDAAFFSMEEVEAVSVQMRIACATGTIFGAVLGQRQFQWQVWGPALTSAIKYEETARPGVVHIAPNTCDLAREAIAQRDCLQKEESDTLFFNRQLHFEKEDVSKRVVEAMHSEGWEVWYKDD